VTEQEFEQVLAEVRSKARENDSPVDYGEYLNKGPNDRVVRIFGCGMRSCLNGDTWVTPDGKWGFYPVVKK